MNNDDDLKPFYHICNAEFKDYFKQWFKGGVEGKEPLFSSYLGMGVYIEVLFHHGTKEYQYRMYSSEEDRNVNVYNTTSWAEMKHHMLLVKKEYEP